MKKIISIILLNILIITIFNSCYLEAASFEKTNSIKIAYGTYNSKMQDAIKNASSLSDNTDASEKATNVLTTIVVAIKIIAVAIAIIMLLVIAMKYMTSAPGDKAEIKKHAVVYIVGAVILFAVTGILSIIQKFATVFDTPSAQK